MNQAVNEPVQIVKKYLAALEKGEYERLRNYLSDSFTYQGPTAQCEDPDSFLAMIWRVGQILNRIELRKIFADGPDVCTIMNFHVHLDVPKVVPVAQWAVVKQGKIASIEVIFDATEYSAMFLTDH